MFVKLLVILFINLYHLFNEIFINANFNFFDDGGPYHIETSPLISSANQWTGFYVIGTSVMKELIK